MKQLIPDVKDMKERKGKNNFFSLLCILASLFAILAFLRDDIMTWVSPPIYTEIHYSYYLVSTECINKFYKDKIDKDGFILLTDEMTLTPECEAEYLGSGTMVVYPQQTERETYNETLNAFTKMKNSGGNLMTIDKIVTRIPTTDDEIYEFQQEQKERITV
jgi:hypothetical protein